MNSKGLHDQEFKLLSDQESVASRCLSYLEKHKSDPESFFHSHKQDMLEVIRDLKLVQGYKSPRDIKTVLTFAIHQVTEEEIKKLFGIMTGEHLMATAEMFKHTYKHMELVRTLKPFKQDSIEISKISPINLQEAFILTKHGKLARVYLDEDKQKAPLVVQATGVRDITQVSKDCVYFCTDTEVKLLTLKGDVHVLNDVSPDKVKSIAITKEGTVLVCCAVYKVFESNMKTDGIPIPSGTYSVMSELSPTGIQRGVAHGAHRDADYMYRVAKHCNEICFLGKGENGGAIQVENDKPKRWFQSINRYCGNIGCDPARTFDPRGICFDDEDQIIIADCRNNALHLLSKGWSFMKFLLRSWDGLKNPTAITLYLNFLWIGQEDGSIQIRRYEP